MTRIDASGHWTGSQRPRGLQGPAPLCQGRCIVTVIVPLPVQAVQPVCPGLVVCSARPSNRIWSLPGKLPAGKLSYSEETVNMRYKVPGAGGGGPALPSAP